MMERVRPTLQNRICRLCRAALPLLLAWLLVTAAQADEDAPESRDYSAVCGGQITWFGDSYSFVAETAYGMISERLPGVDIYCQSGKTFHMDQPATSGGPSGITMLQEMLEQGQPVREVVFALGSNNKDMIYQGVNHVDLLMELLGPERTVILVAPRTFDNTYRDVNREFREAAEKYPNLVIADWAGAVNGRTRMFFNPDRDMLHPTKLGYRLWLDTICAAIPNCVSRLPAPFRAPRVMLHTVHTPAP